MTSVEIIKLCEQKFITGFASSASFYTLAYIIQERLKKTANPILREYSRFIEVIPTTQENVNFALNSTFKDTEDAFQYYTALNASGLNYFITNNAKDFKAAHAMPVVSAKEFMTLILNEL